jgi:uncharacterized membrane protein
MTDHAGYEDRTMPIICYALYLLGFATGGITTIVGVILAHAQQGAAGEIMRSHYTFLIRTFWGFLLLCLAGAILFGIGAILAIVLIGFPIMAVAWLIWTGATVWFVVRCIVGLVHLSRGDAYPRPYAVLA